MSIYLLSTLIELGSHEYWKTDVMTRVRSRFFYKPNICIVGNIWGGKIDGRHQHPRLFFTRTYQQTKWPISYITSIRLYSQLAIKYNIGIVRLARYKKPGTNAKAVPGCPPMPPRKIKRYKKRNCGTEKRVYFLLWMKHLFLIKCVAYYRLIATRAWDF